MKIIRLILGLALLLCLASQAGALVITFDDIPSSGYYDLWDYYSQQYGVGFYGWVAADHTDSLWGPPHSGTKVLMKKPEAIASGIGWSLKKNGMVLCANSMGGYFSTEYGTVLQMIGRNAYGRVVTSPVQIGGTDQAWRNSYVEVGSLTGQISSIEITPVSVGALDEFCVDDVTVAFVPEPSSLLALGSGVVVAGLPWLRRRRA